MDKRPKSFGTRVTRSTRSFKRFPFTLFKRSKRKGILPFDALSARAGKPRPYGLEDLHFAPAAAGAGFGGERDAQRVSFFHDFLDGTGGLFEFRLRAF